MTSPSGGNGETSMESIREARQFLEPPPKTLSLGMDDDLHFTTGTMGWLAGFFARRRAAGDPHDETLVLPALIVVICMALIQWKRLDVWVVNPALVVTAVAAGAWLGASVGYAGAFRAMLRGVAVGAIEAAAGAAMTENVDRHEALYLAYELIYINNFLF